MIIRPRMEEQFNVVQRLETKLVTELDNLENEMTYVDDEEDMSD